MTNVNAGDGGLEPDRQPKPDGETKPGIQPKAGRPPGSYEVKEVIADKVSDKTARELAAAENKRAMTGLIIGGVVIGLGILVVILQVSGAIDLQLQVGSLSANVTTSLAGIIVIIVGLAIIWATRAKIKISNTTP